MPLFLPNLSRFFSDLAHFGRYSHSFFLYFLQQNKSRLSLNLQLVDFQRFEKFDFQQKRKLSTKCATFGKRAKNFVNFCGKCADLQELQESQQLLGRQGFTRSHSQPPLLLYGIIYFRLVINRHSERVQRAWESSTFHLIAIWEIATSLTALAMTLLFIINKPKVYNSKF